MTIVAKNSLTLSNINDGTITHYAYAYSADGKDGFYVGGGTNLLINSNFSSGLNHWNVNQGSNKDCKAIVTTDSDGDTCIHITGTGVACGIYSAPVPFNQNQITTGSVLAKGTGRIFLVGLEGRPTSNFGTVSTESYSKVGSTTQASSNTNAFCVYFSAVNNVVDVYIKFVKLEQGDKDTSWSPEPSEAHPSYIGQYSDFSSTASTDPAKYAPWIIFKGNDGAPGVPGPKGERGKQIFKSSYESIPHNIYHYWSDLSPAPSIDNPPKIGDTIITPSGNILQIDNVNVGGGGGGGTFGVGDVLGNIKGPSGSNGDPGKIVSDTEPTTRFKGLTWKYLGTTDLTASDGTVILSGTEYYWSGTNWILSEINAHNINGNNLTITDGEFSSTIIDGPVQIQTEIKDDHLLIYKMDTSTNSINTIALKSDSGLAMTYQNSDTGEYTSAGVNFQGLFMQNNITNEFARLTPQGTKLSTDVPWTKLSLMNNFTGNIEYAIINGTVYISASGVGVPAMTAGQWKQAAQLPTGSSAIPIRANRITAGDSGDGLSWALLSNQAGGLFIRCSANKAATANLFNATLPYPIG